MLSPGQSELADLILRTERALLRGWLDFAPRQVQMFQAEIASARRATLREAIRTDAAKERAFNRRMKAAQLIVNRSADSMLVAALAIDSFLEDSNRAIDRYDQELASLLANVAVPEERESA